MEGTIKCSEKWEKRIGLDLVPEEERLAYTNTLPNSDDTVGGNSIQHQMKIRAERFDLEYRMKTVDRGYIWTQNKGKIVYNEHGEAIKVYAATLDITERKQMEEELRESERIALDLVEKLRIADKNKNAFINMLSHELRNPLASIMMSLYLMEKISSGEKREARALEIAKRQGIQLTNLVDDLLDITRITQNKIILKKETVEINNLIDMAVQDYRSQFIDKNVKLEVQLTTPLYIEADPSRITQVVGNLLHNAAKFTNSNDLVTVTVSHEINSNQVLITVHDTGRGIAPEFLGNIFEPFIQADKSLDRSLGGLGLGLAIVKGMVELHNGKVQVFSEGIGKGAKFTIWLPLS
ncbi:Sensor histidine kinase TodS [anaerobic digester metagenome]